MNAYHDCSWQLPLLTMVAIAHMPLSAGQGSRVCCLLPAATALLHPSTTQPYLQNEQGNEVFFACGYMKVQKLEQGAEAAAAAHTSCPATTAPCHNWDKGL